MPRPLQFAFFLGAVLLLLAIVTSVVFAAVAELFAINSTRGEWGLAIVLFVLSFSFVVSLLLGMRYYNIFTRAYYHISALWTGSLVYLFIASALYGLVVAISTLLFPTASPNVLGFFLLGVGVLVSVYGAIQARTIRVTNVTVPIQTLPDSWKEMKAVWVSDLHAGQIFGPTFLSKVTTVIESLTPDIIFVGGDLFDGTQAPDVEKLIAPLSKLSAKHGVYFIAGNHEEFGDSGPFFRAIEGVGMRVLRDEKIVVEGVQIVGVDYKTTEEKHHFATILSNLRIQKDIPSVLLKHEPRNLDVAEAAGISLQVSGHTHKGQQWPFGYIASRVHQGYAYGLKAFGSMQVYVSSGVGTWGPPMRVDSRSEIVLMRFSSK